MNVPTRYVPILAGRTGEMEAIERARLGPADAVTPLIDIAAVRYPLKRGEEPPPPPDPKKALCALLDRVAASWTTSQRLLFDVEGFAKFHVVDDMHAVEFLAQEVQRRGLRVAIAVSTTAPFEYRQAVLAQKDRWQDIVVRLSDVRGQSDDRALTLAEGLRLTPSVTDLVIDLRTISGVDEALGDLAGLLGDRGFGGRWGSAVLASTSLPDIPSLKGPIYGVPYRRHERALWAAFKEAIGPKAGFADYGITGPREDSVNPVGDPAPHLRYTDTQDVWIWKGRKPRESGGPPPVDYPELCDSLLAKTKSGKARVFRGAGFSWGDQEIKRATLTRRPGTATKWVAHSTSHHIGQVMRELAS